MLSLLNYILKVRFCIYVMKCCFWLNTIFNFLLISVFSFTKQTLNLIDLFQIRNNNMNCISMTAVNSFSSWVYLPVCLSIVCKYSFVKCFQQFWTTCCLKSSSCYFQCWLKICCYICGQFTLPSGRKLIHGFVKKGHQSKSWAPHEVCDSCVTRLSEWTEGKRSLIWDP